MLKKAYRDSEVTTPFDFNKLTLGFQVLSPEDKVQMMTMESKTKDFGSTLFLDEFPDINFCVDGDSVRANSVVLKARSEYFRAMLSKQYSFIEATTQKYGLVKVSGISNFHFRAVLDFIYTDTIQTTEKNAEFLVRMLMCGDFFLLPRLVQLASIELKRYINDTNVIQILLIAHAHNAKDLERFCLFYIAYRPTDLMVRRDWLALYREGDGYLGRYFNRKLDKEIDKGYMAFVIMKALQMKSVPTS